LILERLPNTLYLTIVAYLVVLLVAIPIGVLTATRQYSWFDHIVTGSTFAFLSTPTFWLGLLLLLFFGLQLRWLPLGGIQTLGTDFSLVDRLRHLILPVATLALVQIGSYTRFLRASMLETIHQDFMRTARAKGLVERVVVLRHALKNAAIPLVTVAALDLPDLFAGALVTEQIFGWPGMGRLFWDSC
jgi:peptide/nickel transport system permease protein